MATTEARQSRYRPARGPVAAAPVPIDNGDRPHPDRYEGAFELLFERYRSRLLAFCRHMLVPRRTPRTPAGVFAASYNAIRADERDLHVRPWLYRIARNRCLTTCAGRGRTRARRWTTSCSTHGTTTADLVHKRADFRHSAGRHPQAPETQRTALLLRELDASPTSNRARDGQHWCRCVKSLLVRARMSLA